MQSIYFVLYWFFVCTYTCHGCCIVCNLKWKQGEMKENLRVRMGLHLAGYQSVTLDRIKNTFSLNKLQWTSKSRTHQTQITHPSIWFWHWARVRSLLSGFLRVSMSWCELGRYKHIISCLFFPGVKGC